MYDYVKKTIVILFLVLLLSVTLTPEALAWGPPGKDGWYLAPDGCWYQGTSQWIPDQGYGHPNCYPDGYPNYWRPYPGYDYHYERCYAPACPYPVPEPYVRVEPPLPCPPGPYYSWGTPMIPDRYHTPWGTFGTYDNWACEFYRQHGRSPNEQDIRDFWNSQQYAAHHCGHPPW